MTDALNDHDLIERGWDMWEASRALPTGPDNLRVAFMMGARHMFVILMGLYEVGKDGVYETKEADPSALEQIGQSLASELAAFCKEYEQRYGPMDGVA
jgi:hypothetical protein